MRGRFAGFALVACAALLSARPVEAGLYNTEDPGPPWSSRIVSGEPPVWPTPLLDQFTYVVKQLRDVRAPQSALRPLYDRRIAELEEKDHAGALSTEDRVNLSAYYYRIQQLDKALAVLEPVKTLKHFMVLSNLGAIYERADRLDRALSFSEQALAAWPELWPGLNRQQLASLYRAEKYHVALLKSRLVEQARQPGKPVDRLDKLDSLFPRVHFRRSDGSYSVGGLPPAQLGELPDDLLLVLEQLLLWNPWDVRLRWLFGEMLNAQGNVFAAAKELDELVYGEKYDAKELREHRAELVGAREPLVKMNQEIGVLYALLWALTPRGATLEPGVGALVNESAVFEREYWSKRMNQPGPTVPPAVTEKPAAPPARQSNLLEQVRTIIVSFVAGCLVTLLILIQFRETRRRLQNAGAARTEA